MIYGDISISELMAIICTYILDVVDNACGFFLRKEDNPGLIMLVVYSKKHIIFYFAGIIYCIQQYIIRQRREMHPGLAATIWLCIDFVCVL